MAFSKSNILPKKAYLKGMIWGSGCFLLIGGCNLLFKKEIISPPLALALLIAIVICYLIGLYKDLQVNRAMKCNVWWWEYPLFVAGLIFAATRENKTDSILLWTFLLQNGVLLLKYIIAKRQCEKVE